jgi:hypothetical protein
MTPEEANAKFGSMYKTEKKNKFNATKAVVKVNGNERTYMSAGEGRYAKELEYQQRQGLIQCFEQQVREKLYSNGNWITDYLVDFLVYHNDGTKEFIEYKGKSTDLWQVKWRMLLAKYKKEITRGEVKCSIAWHKEPYKFKLK